MSGVVRKDRIHPMTPFTYLESLGTFAKQLFLRFLKPARPWCICRNETFSTGRVCLAKKDRNARGRRTKVLHGPWKRHEGSYVWKRRGSLCSFIVRKYKLLRFFSFSLFIDRWHFDFWALVRVACCDLSLWTRVGNGDLPYNQNPVL